MKIWEPEFYDKNCILQYQTALELIKNFSFRADETILDIGSGSGKITHKIATQYIPKGKIIGLDISEQMVNYAQKHYLANNLSFVQEDILEMKYQNLFDVIVSFWTLSWVKDQKLALDNIVKALKPEGRMLITYPLRHDAYNTAEALIQQPQWRKYFSIKDAKRSFITENDYYKIISSLLDMDASISTREIPCNFLSKEEMKASIRSWMAYLDNLSEENLKQQFLNEFIEMYQKQRNLTLPVMYFSILDIRGIKHKLSEEN